METGNQNCIYFLTKPRKIKMILLDKTNWPQRRGNSQSEEKKIRRQTKLTKPSMSAERQKNSTVCHVSG
jgi:hypothetical protein